MTKTRLLLVGLLLVVGLGVMAPSATAIVSGASYFNVNQVAYWVRSNGGAEAMGPITLTFASGAGTVDGKETLTVTYTQPIVGASSISTADIAKFCFDDAGNAFCSAQTLTASGSTLTFVNGNAPIENLLGKTITIYGVRVNAIGLPVSSYITATVTALLDHIDPLYFGPPPLNPITISGLQVGYVAGQAVSVIAPVNCATGELISANSMLTCETFEAYEHRKGNGGGSPGFSVFIIENYSGAWTALSDELQYAPFAPNPGKLVTNGSDMSVTITGIPNGVTVTPTSIDVPSGCTTCNETWEPLPSAYTGTVWNDSHTFDFILATTVHNEIESVIFDFAISTSGLITPDDPPMKVIVQLDPPTTSTTTAPGGLYPWFYYPSEGPGSSEAGTPTNVFLFVDCQTALLFPYVTNYTSGEAGGALGNWDTFLNIANATSDPWYPGKGSAIPQDGACTFYAYGAGLQGASYTGPVEATPIIWTGPVQLSGGEFGTDLGATPAAGITGAYIIAVCNFLNATGYAQVTNNVGLGDWEVMSSYLAYVIPNTNVKSRALAGDNIGEFAITPVNEDWLEDTMWKIFRISAP